MANPRPSYICPSCSSSQHIEVQITCVASLLQVEDDNVETDIMGPRDNDHVWDDDSHMHCTFCHNSGTAKLFREAAEIQNYDWAVRQAADNYVEDGNVEIDGNPPLSIGDDGVWVQAWLFVPYPDDYFDEDEADD